MKLMLLTEVVVYRYWVSTVKICKQHSKNVIKKWSNNMSLIAIDFTLSSNQIFPSNEWLS